MWRVTDGGSGESSGKDDVTGARGGESETERLAGRAARKRKNQGVVVDFHEETSTGTICYSWRGWYWWTCKSGTRWKASAVGGWTVQVWRLNGCKNEFGCILLLCRCGLLFCWTSSMVCLSVGRSVCDNLHPCKNSKTYRDAVCSVDSGWPKEPCIRRGPDADAPCEGGSVEGEHYLHAKWLVMTALRSRCGH